MLFRLLFPSWAFFDAVTDVPRLELRVRSADELKGTWVAVLRAPSRGGRHVLFNPEGNEQLALQAVVDRFAAECETGIADAVSLALVEQIAAQAVRRLASDQPLPLQWQWRVVAVSNAGAPGPPASRLLHESGVHRILTPGHSGAVA
jgi:hypothetical protein